MDTNTSAKALASGHGARAYQRSATAAALTVAILACYEQTLLPYGDSTFVATLNAFPLVFSLAYPVLLLVELIGARIRRLASTKRAKP